MRWFRPKWVIRRIFQAFFLSILFILVLVAVAVYIFSFLPTISVSPAKNYSRIRLISLSEAPTRYIFTTANETQRIFSSASSSLLDGSKSLTFSQRRRNDIINDRCSIYTCFDIYRCGSLGHDTLSVYVYPIEKIFVNGNPIQNHISREFYQVISAIVNSPFYVPDPNKACVFVPTIDLMNLQQISVPIEDIQIALSQLEFWGQSGENHLLFNFFPGAFDVTAISKSAIVASTRFTPESFRPGFHIPLISVNSLLQSFNISSSSNKSIGRKILSVSPQGFMDTKLDDDVLVLDFCPHRPFNYSIRCSGDQIYHYPEVLMKTDFCLVPKDVLHPTLWDVMSVGCIPVIVIDFLRLPFDDVVDWKRNAILLYENQLSELTSILRNVSPERKQRLKSQVHITFKTYFKNIDHVTNTVLEVIKSRVFVHTARSVNGWNKNPAVNYMHSPIFNPTIASRTPGFTAVILAYDRMSSLLQVIERVAIVPSVAKILVVWNNQIKKPPGALSWPKISKPLKIIQTSANKMSNRFYPYDEIETEAVFAVDDDIIMLTSDEIEFGFETWREFPDRIVGFPSRSHVWDNSSQRWKYESEWTNEISMVLTGAAFYHKFWHHAYTNLLPRDIREWVDAKMNCEDIAMNFIVSDLTRKAPIKVTPRKKFKCPTCLNNEMLSSDTSHMVERTDCINKFAQIYGYMPLIPVEFRADPVLFKVDSLPSKLKRFNDIGNL